MKTIRFLLAVAIVCAWASPAKADGAVSGPVDSACAITSVGGLSCWGEDTAGELGNGTLETDSTTPVAVQDLGAIGVQYVTTGSGFNCGINAIGGAYCWGLNTLIEGGNGQLGIDSTVQYADTATQVNGMGMGTAQISAGQEHVCAVGMVGNVMCWGSNQYGQLGTGNKSSTSTPIGALMLTSGVKQVAAGFGHTCALTTSGEVYCWGVNTYGVLGTNGPMPTLDACATKNVCTESLSTSPLIVEGLPAITELAAEWDGMCGMTSAGAVWCWGAGYMATTSNPYLLNTPAQIAGLPAVAGIGGGWEGLSNCAWTSAGVAYCWGFNEDGALGNGTTTSSLVTPVKVSTITGVTAMSTGQVNACAKAGGHIYCWGKNNAGQLGNGGTQQSLVPVEVSGM
jgi:alpha-tubulin suppressor-like RCC1 family protein